MNSSNNNGNERNPNSSGNRNETNWLGITVAVVAGAAAVVAGGYAIHALTSDDEEQPNNEQQLTDEHHRNHNDQHLLRTSVNNCNVSCANFEPPVERTHDIQIE